MKDFLNSHIHLIALIFISVVSGCREEITEIEEPPEEEILSVDDITVQNVLRMLEMDGSFDNILDRSSCNSIELPVDIVVNNQTLTINTIQDFNLIDQIHEMSGSDEDTLYLIFPVNVVFPDHSTTQVSSYNEFSSIVNECSNEEDNDIECIDFAYPIDISLYNRNAQIADVIEFENDRELYDYLDQLSDDLIVGFKYPLTMTQDGTMSMVQDNDQLNSAIVAATNTCDEDDEVLSEEEEAVNEGITSGTWRISLYEDVVNLTNIFNESEIQFNLDGTVWIDTNEDRIFGTWESGLNEILNVPEIDLEFDTDIVPIIFLNETWKVSMITSSEFQMFSEEEDNRQKMLTIERI